MLLPHGTLVAVADGETLNLYRNTGTDAEPKLSPVQHGEVSGDNKGAGAHHGSSSANPDDSRLEEDSFAAATAAMLNKQALSGKFDGLFVIAAPKTLGELRKHYHSEVSARLSGELDKDLTGHPIDQIDKALQAA